MASLAAWAQRIGKTRIVQLRHVYLAKISAHSLVVDHKLMSRIELARVPNAFGVAANVIPSIALSNVRLKKGRSAKIWTGC